MKKEIQLIRRWLIFFMIALFLSGLTAMPLETELAWLLQVLPAKALITEWIARVYLALAETNTKYPFIAYGADWLAFAHFVLALLFIGPYKDPVRNKWIIEFGMIACLLIIPFAFIAGEIRGIPVWWRLIDCSFGVIGLVPLSICLKRITQLEELQKQPASLYK
ncbi:MAG TPA: hypothetical protein VK644_11275 [Chitinophagaceae bacterium]|nr:hypothetical protein [Chitinophagaceae bacterium]